jgi:hypothetical protein
MNYGYIVNRAFQIAWRHKSLWVFGLFAGGFGNFNLDAFTHFLNPDSSEIGAVPNIAPEILGALVLLGVLFSIIFIVAYCIAAPALVDGVNRVERGGVYRFGSSFSAGVDNFFRFFGLGVLFFLTMFGVVMIFVVLGIIAAIMAGVSMSEASAGSAVALVILAVLVALPLFILLYLAIMTPFTLAQRVIVVRNAGIADALSEGWLLFKRNFGKSFVIFLIHLGISIAVGIALLLLFAIVALVVMVFVPNPMEHIAEFIILGLLFGLPISLLLGGFFGTFHSALYTLFYFELVEPAASRQPYTSPPPIMPGTAG